MTLTRLQIQDTRRNDSGNHTLARLATHLTPQGRKVETSGLWRKPALSLLGAGVLALSLSAGEASARWPSTGFEHFSGLTEGQAQPVIEQARQVLDKRFLDHQPLGAALEVMRVVQTEDGMQHVRLNATFEGLRVEDSEAIVHFNPDGSFDGLTDALVRDVEVDTRPLLSADEAIRLAETESHFTATPMLPSHAELMIFSDQTGPHLTWRVTMNQMDGSEGAALPVVLVEAQTGDFLLEYDNLQRATGTGTSSYYGSVKITTLLKGTSYYMEDTTRKFGVFDARGGTTYYRSPDSNNTWDASNQKSMVDAQYAAGLYIDYLYKTFARKGLDGAYGKGSYSSADGKASLVPLVVHFNPSTANPKESFADAAWVIPTDDAGNQLAGYGVFGDGDGVYFTNMTSIDIVAHELTHGLIQYTANLGYTGETGAVNESMADIFGTLTEFYGNTVNSTAVKPDYYLGEDAYTPTILGDALRYMDNTHLAANKGCTADDDPDHYSERSTLSTDPDVIHCNAGIMNKAFWLLSVGGTHHLGGSMTGITQAKAAQIYYKALTAYMTSGSNFSGARDATLRAAKALYGANSTEQKAVDQSWTMVGVTTPTLAAVNAS